MVCSIISYHGDSSQTISFYCWTTLVVSQQHNNSMVKSRCLDAMNNKALCDRKDLKMADIQ